MTPHRDAPQTVTAAPSFVLRARDALAVYLKARVLIVLFLGFVSGLPLALSGSTLQVWMKEAGVDLRTIGLFAFAGTPYTIKFLWAPLVDALDIPLLSRRLGRRRGWLVFTQLALMAAVVLLGFADPGKPLLVIVGAFLVAMASATQDIVIDAFRVESLDENEQAAGMASYVAAYRVGMLISTAGALFMVSGFEAYGLDRQTAWQAGYAAMALLVIVGIATSLAATEPPQSDIAGRAHAHAKPLARLTETAIGSFKDFLTQDAALVVLAFVVLFKFTDALAGVMTAPFVIDIGFTRNEYAAIIKGLGFAATLIGGFAGGFLARAFSLVTCLWIGGALQALANLAFSWQATRGADLAALSLAITLENFTSAIGTVIFVAYLSSLCRNPLHTATQYALLTALAAVGRTYMSAFAGYLAAATGWVWFFAICAAAGLPSLLLLAYLQRRGHFDGLRK
jgi:PAT family beta-lactamase induction signal transducer AmpG